MNDKEKAFWVNNPDWSDHVYCKDCRYFTESGWCELWKMDIRAIGNCYAGKRKDNE